METPLDAYAFLMLKLLELRDDKIHFEVLPKKKLDFKWDKETGIPPDKWVRIYFSGIDKLKGKKILEMANYLLICGITFDSGGRCGERDWEIDRSFRFKKGEEDMELLEAREQVENDISQNSKNL